MTEPGTCATCGDWPIEADKSNDDLSMCCGSELIGD